MANEWQLGLIAGLDGTKSKSQLNSDINGLAKQLDKLKLYAEIDQNQVTQLQQQLKKLQIELNNVTVSDAVINGLVSKINAGLQNVNIGNINVGNVNNQAQQVGQQIGQQINQGVSQGLGNNSRVLDTFKRSLQNIGMGSGEIDTVATRINNLNVQIESLNQSVSRNSGKNGNRSILSVDISGTDQFGQAIKLTEQYDITTGKLIRSLDAVSSAQQKAGASTNAFAQQQSRAVSNLTNQINQLNRAATDQNASRPITDSSHLDSLSVAYDEIVAAIQKMGTASSNTFVEEQNHVKELISNYKSLVSEYKNAENVSTKMKGTDFASGLSIAKNDLEKLKADAKDFPQLVQTINTLDNAITNVGDTSSLNAFNDQLRVARAELAKIKAEVSAVNRSEKVGINVSGLQSQIADLQRISPEIDRFEAEINGAKVTVQSLLADLNAVNTQGDFSVINSKWKAFTNAAKSAGIAITEVGTKSDSAIPASQKRINNLANAMLSFKTNNSAMSKELSNDLDVMYRSLINGANLSEAEVKELETRFTSLKLQVREAGNLGKSFEDKLKDNVANFMSWGFATGLTTRGLQLLREMYNAVYDIDTAMTDLYKVTDETDEKYNEFLMNACENAQELGRTVSSLIEQTANWAKLG